MGADRAETTYGRVVGVRVDDLVVFRGIPYGAPPVGEWRFRPPQAPRPWSGEREATSFGPLSVQPPPGAGTAIPGDPSECSEDCLYLNVVTPACDGGARPVMVFVHGGGFTGGASSSALYAGERLARHGVVVVTFNYRLGALGWLAHPGLADPDRPEAGSGNFGLHDQLAALEWVAANISSFGGDPGNVTVFGESAGAMSVAALLATSAPRRLFRRAILQSGAAVALGPVDAEQIAEEVAAEAGLSRLTREGLAAIPAEELLRAQQAVASRHEQAGLSFQPVVDGGLLGQHPAAAMAAGSAAGVDLVVGTNRDEWRFWILSNPALRELDEDGLRRRLTHVLGGAGLAGRLDAAETAELYRRALEARGCPSAPADLYCALVSDLTFRVPAMRLALGASGARPYAYLFDWESPFGGGVLGSCHALELPFVFGTCANEIVSIFSGGGAEGEGLSEVMRTAWTDFAASGEPGGEAVGEWPVYSPSRRETKRLGRVVEVLEAPMEEERAWLDSALGPYGVGENARLSETRFGDVAQRQRQGA